MATYSIKKAVLFKKREKEIFDNIENYIDNKIIKDKLSIYKRDYFEFKYEQFNSYTIGLLQHCINHIYLMNVDKLIKIIKKYWFDIIEMGYKNKLHYIYDNDEDEKENAINIRTCLCFKQYFDRLCNMYINNSAVEKLDNEQLLKENITIIIKIYIKILRKINLKYFTPVN